MAPTLLERGGSEERPATTQAALLRGRGDLKNSKLRWKADLSDTSSVHLRASPMERLGFRLKHGAASMGLCVRGIADEYRGRDTPIVEYNIKQERRHQPLYKIHPGDRIRAVNRSRKYDEMIRELHDASEKESELCISLEREMKDVLEAPGAPSPGPSPTIRERMSKSMSEGALVAQRNLLEAPEALPHCGLEPSPCKDRLSLSELRAGPDRLASPLLASPDRLGSPFAPSPGQVSARELLQSPPTEALVRRAMVAKSHALRRRSSSLTCQAWLRDRARSPSPSPDDTAQSWLPAAMPPVVTISRSPVPTAFVGGNGGA